MFYFGIDMIIFIGLIVMGKKVVESCVKMLKCYVLEFGGNDVVIVCDDVDFDKCIFKIVIMIFMNLG